MQDDAPSPETLIRFRELLLDTMKRHLATADALDTKAWQALGVGSIVLGLGVAGELRGYALIVALGAYGALAYGAFRCVRVRGWKAPPEGDDLWRDGWNLEPEDFDHTIVKALTIAEPINRKAIGDKAAAVSIAIIGLAAEITILTIAAAFA